MGAVGLMSVRAIAGRGRRAPIFVRFGPGPELPFSPILWQARQPDDAATSLPFPYCGADFRSMLLRAPARAPSTVRYAMAGNTALPVREAVGRLNRLRARLPSMNGR